MDYSIKKKVLRARYASVCVILTPRILPRKLKKKGLFIYILIFCRYVRGVKAMQNILEHEIYLKFSL